MKNVGRVFQDIAGSIGDLVRRRYGDAAYIKGANGVEVGTPVLDGVACFDILAGYVAGEGGIWETSLLV